MKIIRPLFKIGLGGGAVYLAVQTRLFSDDQKETIEASQAISKSLNTSTLEPYLNKVSIGLSKQDLTNYWNSGVKATFRVLADLPSDTKDLSSRSYHYVVDEISKQINAEKKQ